MENLANAIVRGWTCGTCGHVYLFNINQVHTEIIYPRMFHRCAPETANQDTETIIRRWVYMNFYNGNRVKQTKVAKTLRHLRGAVPDGMLPRLYQIVCMAHIFAPLTSSMNVRIKWVHKVRQLFQRAHTIYQKEAYDIYFEMYQRRRPHGVGGFRQYKRDMLIANYANVNPLLGLWEMDTTNFTNAIQWLPKEMVEDIGILLGRIHPPTQ